MSPSISAPENSEEQKTRFAERIAEDITDVLKHGEESVSLSIEEVEPQEWIVKVYKPDIPRNPANVYKKPGYNPLEK